MHPTAAQVLVQSLQSSYAAQHAPLSLAAVLTCLFRSAHTAAWLGEMCRAFLPLRPATYNPISPEREEKRVRYKSHLYTLKDNMLP